MKIAPLACYVTLGLFALAACDVKATPVDDPFAQSSVIYGEQPKGDQGVSGRCAKIVNPAERRKCIQTSG
ncbi:MAG: hypothetical protein K0Q70_314 [Rhodospirillales bacterium]|nr:hypothetical protein [Rhodospirillales bacterium]